MSLMNLNKLETWKLECVRPHNTLSRSLPHLDRLLFILFCPSIPSSSFSSFIFITCISETSKSKSGPIVSVRMFEFCQQTQRSWRASARFSFGGKVFLILRPEMIAKTWIALEVWCSIIKTFFLINHKKYNFLHCDWFKKLLFSTNSFAKLLSDSLLSDSLLSDSLLSDKPKYHQTYHHQTYHQRA